MKSREILKKMLIPLMAGLAILFAGQVYGQDAPKLDVGDPVPPIRYSKWLKGDPIDNLDPNRIYVLEFWATWCGPCKANMPHLTELQKQYEKDVTIIGVGAMERVGEGQPYDSSLPMVERFVEGNSENMGYSVMADNNDQYMTNYWFKASGQNGIPAAYVVKNNILMWMGHPQGLDEILPQVIDGTYDMEGYKLARAKRAEASRAQAEARAEAMRPIDEAVEAKDYQTAFALMEEAKAEQPRMSSSLNNMKFKILLENFSSDEMKAFGEEWKDSDRMATYTMLTEISRQEDLPKDIYLWAANNFADGNPDNGNPFTLDMLSICFEKGGDLNGALTSIEKAAQIGRAALTNPELAGAIDEPTVIKYETKVKDFQKRKK